MKIFCTAFCFFASFSAFAGNFEHEAEVLNRLNGKYTGTYDNTDKTRCWGTLLFKATKNGKRNAFEILHSDLGSPDLITMGTEKKKLHDG